MILSTPGLVLHTTPYGETSVVAKIFTRQLGVKSYIIKGVRGRGARTKQNLLQPLSAIDMVVYDNHRSTLNYIREITPRRHQQQSEPVGNALRFFMTEVLYKALREDEPMPDLWDYVEACSNDTTPNDNRKDIPIQFMLTVAFHLGIEPLNNHSASEHLFDLQQGRFSSEASDTTLSDTLSDMLHNYLAEGTPQTSTPHQRREMILALIAYYQLHLSGFTHFTSHEILHTVLR